MKAIVIHAHGGIDKLSYEEIAAPKPGPGEVLVRVRAAGVNHFDHDIREGMSGHGQAMPHILGVEGAGEVAENGPGAVRYAAGQRVAIKAFSACGHCRNCRAGHDETCLNGSALGVTRWGTWAEYVCCDESQLFALPDAVTFEQAAASIVVMPTAWHMTVGHGRVQAGWDVLVNAAGSGVGSAAIQIAKLHGARVIAAAGSDEKIARAKALGADDGINYTTHDLAEETLALTGGKGAELVIECVGGELLKKCLTAVAPLGAIVTCGGHGGEETGIDIITLFRKQVRLQGSFYASLPEALTVFDLIAEGALKPVIHSTLPLAQAAEAAELTANRNFFGNMVLMV